MILHVMSYLYGSSMYLCVGVGVIGSIYLYIEGWAFNVLIHRGGHYWYTVLVQEHIRMGGLSKSV